MITYKQLLEAIRIFIENDMVSRASGNYKIILRTLSSTIQFAPDKVWSMISNNPIITSFIDPENIDVDLLENILCDGLSTNEFELSFNLFGTDYKIFLNSDDVKKLKSYIRRT